MFCVGASGTAPCDNADAGEDIILEYSTNNGLTWVPIQTFGQDNYPGFEPVEVIIPPKTLSVRLQGSPVDNASTAAA